MVTLILFQFRNGFSTGCPKSPHPTALPSQGRVETQNGVTVSNRLIFLLIDARLPRAANSPRNRLLVAEFAPRGGEAWTFRGWPLRLQEIERAALAIVLLSSSDIGGRSTHIDRDCCRVERVSKVLFGVFARRRFGSGCRGQRSTGPADGYWTFLRAAEVEKHISLLTDWRQTSGSNGG